MKRQRQFLSSPCPRPGQSDFRRSLLDRRAAAHAPCRARPANSENQGEGGTPKDAGTIKLPKAAAIRRQSIGLYFGPGLRYCKPMIEITQQFTFDAAHVLEGAPDYRRMHG